MNVDRREWLEADGLGGFASGTVSGVRTRRYHALLLAAARPPAERFVLVNGIEAHVETASGRHALSSQRYLPGVVHPDGASRIESFRHDPWPAWTFRLPDGSAVEQEIVAIHGSPAVLLHWKRLEGFGPCRLEVRPLFSGRDFHALHRENDAFRFEPEPAPRGLRFRPYDGVPPVLVSASGAYRHAPEWYRNFDYEEERRRGLDHVEDLASPGFWNLDLAAGDGWLLLGAGGVPAGSFDELLTAERRRRARFEGPLDRAADAYLVARGEGRTVIAGYPWFGDWGRDTFLALRGLCLATNRLEDAGAILREWAGAVSDGMLPNRFPDRGETPEYNSVDASLWYVIAVGEYQRSRAQARRPAKPGETEALRAACEAILDGYLRGTRYGIRVDVDGLVACGEPGVQLTWMDAKVGDWVVTPRTGKPVEIQGLWVRALRTASMWTRRYTEAEANALASLRARFPNPSNGYLHDVVDVDHERGRVDSSVRPNAVLVLDLLEPDAARRSLDVFERRLWTPLGPRSLAPEEPGYRGVYRGGPVERDGSYHQGTVWPWLAGPFVECWVHLRGNTAEAKREARTRFVDPLLAHVEQAGLGHVSEIADGDAPHVPAGCPFQAWSLGELLRLERVVLADEASVGGVR